MNKLNVLLTIHPSSTSQQHKIPFKKTGRKKRSFILQHSERQHCWAGWFHYPLVCDSVHQSLCSERWKMTCCVCARMLTRLLSTSLQQGTQAHLVSHIPCLRDKGPLRGACFGSALCSLASTRQLGTGLQECAVLWETQKSLCQSPSDPTTRR